MKIFIKKGGTGDIALIEDLARRSWPVSYGDILSEKQIVFMLEDIYSSAALARAMNQGQVFYILYSDGLAVGFMALITVQGVLRIEKLYLLPQVQGQGLGKRLIDYAASVCQNHGLAALELNVNRKNKAYSFYLKQGFRVLYEVDIPYHGFVLDDYVMRKDLL
ncbi:MAG: GNAT family N-acetyltransferase [Sphingobacterium sp.]